MTTEKGKALDLAISQIEKRFGKGAIMKLGEPSTLSPTEVIPSGALALDLALGVGVFPEAGLLKSTGPNLQARQRSLCTQSLKDKRGGVLLHILMWSTR